MGLRITTWNGKFPGLPVLVLSPWLTGATVNGIRYAMIYRGSRLPAASLLQAS